MVTYQKFCGMRSFRQILLVVNTLAKAKAIDYNMILTYHQLLGLPSQSNHQYQGDKLNLDSKGCLGIETLLSKT